MKKAILYSIIVFIGLSSCQYYDSNKLSDILKVKEIFTEREINSMSEILIYFDNFINEATGISDIDSAYHRYCENLRYNNSYEEFWNKLKVNRIENDQFIKTLKKNDVFEEFWNVGFETDHETGDTVGFYLLPNINGKYIELLNYLCGDYPELIEYKESILAAGAIPPTIVGGFQNIHSKLDFSNEKVRLFVALHYITIRTYLDKPVKP